MVAPLRRLIFYGDILNNSYLYQYLKVVVDILIDRNSN